MKNNFILSGFEKVASVIESNPSYDDIMGKRVKRHEYVSMQSETGNIESNAALQYFSKKITGERRGVVKLLPDGEEKKGKIFYYGSTENNKREFSFFERKAALYGYSVCGCNIALCEGVKVSSEDWSLKKMIVSSFSYFLLSRREISKSLLHQSISYAVSLLAAKETLKELKLELFVVANDHSPIPVAYSKMASFFGAKVVYVQHAEVTNNFPKLDFDYSVLRNKKSLDIYKHKGLSGNVIYLDRGSKAIDVDSLKKEKLKLRQSNSIDVVIYPSAIFNRNKLVEMFKELKKNQSVFSISIKPHPSTKDFSFFENTGINIKAIAPNKKHVAICGNSSVAVELLAQGNLVFNFFEMDNISPDYYGFVEKGMLERLVLSECKNAFWKGSRQINGLGMIGDYFPSVDTRRNKLENMKEKFFFSQIVDKNTDINVLRSAWFERDIFCFSNTFLNVLRKEKKVPYDCFWMLKKLNEYFNDRDVRLSKLYQKASLSHCESVVDFWLNSKSIEWNGTVPTACQLNILAQFSVLPNHDRKVRGWLELKCFDIFLRFGSPVELYNFIKKAKIIDVYKLGINKKIAFINYASSNLNYRKELESIYRFDNDELSLLDKLKVYVQVGCSVKGIPDSLGFRAIENLFIKAHEKLAEEYKNSVMDIYDYIGDRACLIDVKFDARQRDEFFEIIKKKLLCEEGFSFIRLSDGEGFIFRAPNSVFSELDALNRQRHWWGEEITLSVVDELQTSLQKAICNADILGIPSVYRFVRDHSEKTSSLSQSLQGRGLLTVLGSLKNIDSEDKLYTDDKANIAIFNKIENIKKLASFSKKVVIVNSGSLSSVEKAFGKYFDYVHIGVPTHHKTSTNAKYLSGPKPLPYIYKEIVDDVKREAVPGALVLVGAGVAGKVFMDAAKEKGAVALDLGSAMDQLLSGGIHSLF